MWRVLTAVGEGSVTAAVGTGKAGSPPGTVEGIKPAGRTQPLGCWELLRPGQLGAPASLEQSGKKLSEPQLSRPGVHTHSTVRVKVIRLGGEDATGQGPGTLLQGWTEVKGPAAGGSVGSQRQGSGNTWRLGAGKGCRTVCFLGAGTSLRVWRRHVHSREEAGESSCCCGLRNWVCYRMGAQRALLGPLSSPALTGEQSGFKMP